jgi:hypothetical protein
MSPDPYDGSYDFTNPQSLNRYTYALNNPLSWADPSGLDTCGDAQGNQFPFYTNQYDCNNAGYLWFSDSQNCIDIPGRLVCNYATTVTPEPPQPEPPPTEPVSSLSGGGYLGGGGGVDGGGGTSTNNSCSATPSLWPHGVAGVVNGEGTIGLSKLGATAQGTAGLGIFGGTKQGRFFSYVATAVAGFHNPGVPYQQGGTNPTIVGIGLGVGAGGMITNATSAQQISGLFQQFTLSLPAVSLSFSYGNGIWTLSGAVGPGAAAATTSTTTNTKVKGPC